MECMAFLEKPDAYAARPIYVLTGNESFLKNLAITALRRTLLGEADESGMAFTLFEGEALKMSTLVNELATVPFLSERRLVVVDQAEEFVSANRPALEDYFTKQKQDPSKSSSLILDVKSWPSNTKLAKLTPEAWRIECDTPDPKFLGTWCANWCSSHYGKQLPLGAAKHLVNLVGDNLGLLDSELQKLCVYVGEAKKIELKDVETLVGRSRTQEVWEMFDLMSVGNASEALTRLERMLDQGQAVGAIWGAVSSTMRRAVQIARLNAQGLPLPEAMRRVGLNHPDGRRTTEQLLRHLGRRRLDQLFDWLVKFDLDTKSTAQLDERVLLERLIVRLARTREGGVK
jgi:DNA polymerase-3 subunit delta